MSRAEVLSCSECRVLNEEKQSVQGAEVLSRQRFGPVQSVWRVKRRETDQKLSSSQTGAEVLSCSTHRVLNEEETGQIKARDFHHLKQEQRFCPGRGLVQGRGLVLFRACGGLNEEETEVLSFQSVWSVKRRGNRSDLKQGRGFVLFRGFVPFRGFVMFRACGVLNEEEKRREKEEKREGKEGERRGGRKRRREERGEEEGEKERQKEERGEGGRGEREREREEKEEEGKRGGRERQREKRGRKEEGERGRVGEEGERKSREREREKREGKEGERGGEKGGRDKEEEEKGERREGRKKERRERKGGEGEREGKERKRQTERVEREKEEREGKEERKEKEKKVTEIKTNIFVTSFGPVSDTEMEYTIDVFFRQSWKDERLCFKGPMKQLALNNLLASNIWTPDTFFLNDAYPVSEVVYIWTEGAAKSVVVAEEGSRLNQYHLIGQTAGTEDIYTSRDAYPVSEVVYIWTEGAAKSVVVAEEGSRLNQYHLIGQTAGTEDIYTSRGRTCKYIHTSRGRTNTNTSTNTSNTNTIRGPRTFTPAEKKDHLALSKKPNNTCSTGVNYTANLTKDASISTISNSTAVQLKPAESKAPDPKKTYNSVSKIDKMSRIVFPVLFGTFNLVYWATYLNREPVIKGAV
ncbi:hypothetical protein WMY93_032952 [Mugilogobius chulae]|uniref:Uncharacterized protein n=1 Tax=Mugilogobius chulae TaxID=88201 RepID=A0AAW0MVC0_9GOBI